MGLLLRRSTCHLSNSFGIKNPIIRKERESLVTSPAVTCRAGEVCCKEDEAVDKLLTVIFRPLLSRPQDTAYLPGASFIFSSPSKARRKRKVHQESIRL